MQIPGLGLGFPFDSLQENSDFKRKESLVGRRAGWIGEGNQLPYRILFLRERNFGLGIHYGEHIAAVHASQEQAVAFHTHHAIFLVEDELPAHTHLDARRDGDDARLRKIAG